VSAPDVGPRHLCRFIIRQIKRPTLFESLPNFVRSSGLKAARQPVNRRKRRTFAKDSGAKRRWEVEYLML
jgi:hypothetical protein